MPDVSIVANLQSDSNNGHNGSNNGSNNGHRTKTDRQPYGAVGDDSDADG